MIWKSYTPMKRLFKILLTLQSTYIQFNPFQAWNFFWKGFCQCSKSFFFSTLPYNFDKYTAIKWDKKWWNKKKRGQQKKIIKINSAIHDWKTSIKQHQYQVMLVPRPELREIMRFSLRFQFSYDSFWLYVTNDSI
jgi:hypothetical protein